MDDSEITRDSLLRGRVRLLQPRRGLRSSLDPVLLAGFVTPPFGDFLDIGCGTGALAFLLMAQDPNAHGVGIEIQPRLAELAGEGARENGFDGRFRVIASDARAKGVLAERAFDMVISNPPFRPLGTGVLPPLSERALANHEVTLALDEWLDVAALVLRPEGRLAVIFPFERQEQLRAGLVERGLSHVRARPVVSRRGLPPQRLLVEARQGASVWTEEPVLVVHSEAGFSPEVRKMLGEDA